MAGMTNLKRASELHAEYLKLVGGDLALTLDRIYWWEQWALNSWGVEELRLVIGHLQAQIRKGKRFEGSLRWSRLIQQADNFGEELQIARAERRNAKPAPTAKERVLQSLRPTVVEAQPKDNCSKTAGQAAEKALADLRKWKADTFGPRKKQP